MMVHSELLVSNNLLDEFTRCLQDKYTGKLDIISSKGHKWSFYFRLGRIIWAGGGNHPYRRWRRQMTQHCPQVNIHTMQLRSLNLTVEYWDYQLLVNLYKITEIEGKQFDAIAQDIIAELLLDLAQQSNFSSMSCSRNSQVVLELPINFTSTNIFLKRMEKEWQIWSSAGLATFSPDLAPLLKQPERLQQIVHPDVYKNFVTLANGKHTLRDLAVKMRQGVLQIASSLLPFILKGLIELVEIPDLDLPVIEVKKNTHTVKSKLPNSPLVACVDDSLQVCQTLERIIISNGMRFIGIQDTITALPTLIEHKPDLIFLDLIMPVANGYEIASQIRRISKFSDTPIIILTGSDGVFDRIRAKIAGSTDFIGKPIVADKITSLLHKYLNKEWSLKNSSHLQLCHT